MKAKQLVKEMPVFKKQGILIFTVALAFLAGIFHLSLSSFIGQAFGKTNTENCKKPQSILSPIYIKGGSCDSSETYELLVEDVFKYRGKVSACSIVTYRALKAAFAEIWAGETPARNEISIINRHPCGGSRDTFEFVTRAVTSRGNNYRMELPEKGTRGKMSADNFSFSIIRGADGEAINIRVKESVFPEGFFSLRQKAKTKNPDSGDIEAFEKMQERVKNRFLTLPHEKLFLVERMKTAE